MFRLTMTLPQRHCISRESTAIDIAEESQPVEQIPAAYLASLLQMPFLQMQKHDRKGNNPLSNNRPVNDNRMTSRRVSGCGRLARGCEQAIVVQEIL
jgi:hypothetical protein